jgi:hypothetical protein
MTIADNQDVRPGLERQAVLTKLMLTLVAVLVVVVIALLVQVRGLRNDVTVMQRDVSAQVAAGVPASLISLDDSPQVCALLGAIAGAHGIRPAQLFADDTSLEACEQFAATAAARR